MPEEVVKLLSEFFSRMVEVILRNEGTIDKFLGDGMMVIFGAPVDDPNQEERAVRAALEMQHELAQLAAAREAQGRRSFKMGIGINSGPAVLGNIGSQEHMEYTAIGDTVNLAVRLQTASKELGAEIVVSEHTHNAVRTLYRWRSLGEVFDQGPRRNRARLRGRGDRRSLPHGIVVSARELAAHRRCQMRADAARRNASHLPLARSGGGRLRSPDRQA